MPWVFGHMIKLLCSSCDLASLKITLEEGSTEGPPANIMVASNPARTVE